MTGRPLRTYQRKQKKSQPVITSTIVKAPISIDPYTSNDDDDDNNDYDNLQNDNTKKIVNPFETTFDRIAKDVKLPPLPSPGPDESFYNDSSSFDNKSNDDDDNNSLNNIPWVNPVVEVSKKKNNKRKNNINNMNDNSPWIKKSKIKINNNEDDDNNKYKKKRPSRKKDKKQITKKNINNKITKIKNEDKKLKRCNIELIRLENESNINNNESIEEVKKSSSALYPSTNSGIKIRRIEKKLSNKNKLNISEIINNENSSVNLTINTNNNNNNTHETSGFVEKTNHVFSLLKNCYVDVVKLDIKQNNLIDNNSSIHDVDNSNNILSHNLTMSKVNTNSRFKFIKPKKCHVNLIRIDTLKSVNNSHLNVDNITLNDQTLLSSTPVNTRIKKRQTRPKLSPININTNVNDKLNNLKNKKSIKSVKPLLLKDKKISTTNKNIKQVLLKNTNNQDNNIKLSLNDLINYDKNNDIDDDIDKVNLALKLARKSYDFSELKEISLYKKTPVKKILTRDNNINVANRILTPLSTSIDEARSPLLFDDSSVVNVNDKDHSSIFDSSESMEPLKLASSPDVQSINKNKQDINETIDMKTNKEIIQQNENNSIYDNKTTEDKEFDDEISKKNVNNNNEEEKTISIQQIEDIEKEDSQLEDVTNKKVQSNETIDDKNYKESVIELIQNDVERNKEYVTDVFINDKKERDDNKQHQMNGNDESLENTTNLSSNSKITVENTHDYSSEINNTDNLSPLQLDNSKNHPNESDILSPIKNTTDVSSLSTSQLENYQNESDVISPIKNTTDVSLLSSSQSENSQDYQNESDVISPIKNTTDASSLSSSQFEDSQDYQNESDVLSSMKNTIELSSSLADTVDSIHLNNTKPLIPSDEYFSITNNTQDLLSTNNSSDSIQSDSSQDLPIEFDEVSSTSTVLNPSYLQSRMNDFDDLLTKTPIKINNKNNNDITNESNNNTTENQDNNDYSKLKENTPKKSLLKKYRSFEEDDIIVSDVKNKKFVRIRSYSNEDELKLNNESKMNKTNNQSVKLSDESHEDDIKKNQLKKSYKNPINQYAFELGLKASNENIYEEVAKENDKSIREIKTRNKSKKSSLKLNNKTDEIKLNKNDKKKKNSKSVKINNNISIEKEINNKNNLTIKNSIDFNKLNISNKLPIVLLERLNDSVKITNKTKNNSRNKKSVYFQIPENENDKNDDGDDNNDDVNDIMSVQKNNESIQVLYLKPGKQWARSLSILNQINNNKQDINKMGFGKGKKWRQSVVDVYNMQNEHGTSKKSANDIFKTKEIIKSLNEDDEHENENDNYNYNYNDNKTKKSIIKPKSLLESSDLTKHKKLSTYNHERKTSVVLPRRTTIYNPRVTNIDTNKIIPNSPTKSREVVFKRCQQNDFIPISNCYTDNYLKYCRKIGEGVYGEVFLYNKNNNDTSVIKIIPIEGEQLVNGEPQKKYHEILSEIIIAEELHKLRFNNNYKTSGFCEVKSIKCLIGKYPNKLIDLWNIYDEEKTSENDSPSMFDDKQLYISLELGNGGQDLEAFIFQNATESYSTFIQIALTLAVGEKSLNFEHRDMHWGNILIKKTKDNIMFYKFDNEEIQYSCQGIKVSIIDFTLSRITHNGCCMYNDLSLDPSLFTAVGEYQFDVYRLMKARLQNDWKRYEPSTNILWLHYTLDKMLTAVRYKYPTSKIHKKHIEKIQQLKDQILDYESSYHFISECNLITGLKRYKI